ncbi:MAG: PAS-domain containing protein [Pseudomonadota bacterium]
MNIEQEKLVEQEPPDKGTNSPQENEVRESSDHRLAVERLSTAAYLLRGWLWETDAEGRFTYLSDSVLNFSGRPAEWHYGKTREDLGNYVVNPASLEEIREKVAAREPFGPVEYQRIQSGKPFWMQTRGLPMFDNQGNLKGYRGIAYDITTEVQQRECESDCDAQIERALEILCATVDCFPGAVSVYDHELKLAFANSKYYALLDLPMAQFPVGARYIDLLYFLGERGELRGGELSEVIENHMQMAQSGEIHTFCRTRPNGVCIEIASVPLPGGGFVRTYTDVTAVSELRWKLQSSEREVQQLRARLNAAQLEIDRLQTTAHRAAG